MNARKEFKRNFYRTRIVAQNQWDRTVECAFSIWRRSKVFLLPFTWANNAQKMIKVSDKRLIIHTNNILGSSWHELMKIQRLKRVNVAGEAIRMSLIVILVWNLQGKISHLCPYFISITISLNTFSWDMAIRRGLEFINSLCWWETDQRLTIFACQQIT